MSGCIPEDLPPPPSHPLVESVGRSCPVSLPFWFLYREGGEEGCGLILFIPPLRMPVSYSPLVFRATLFPSLSLSGPLVVPASSAACGIEYGARYLCTAPDIVMTRRCGHACSTCIARSYTLNFA